MASRVAKPKSEVDPATVGAFAREFADWRLGHCPGTGFYAAFKVRVEKAAKRHGRTFADLFGEVHREASKIIEAA